MAMVMGSFNLLEYLRSIISSYPNEVTVLILLVAYVIKPEESLYAKSVLALNPVVNSIWIAPEIIIRGMSPSATRVVCQSYMKAMIMPETKVEMFWTSMPIKLVVNPLTFWQSEASRADKAPLLFRGLSNHGIGILRIFLYVYPLSFVVISSPIMAKAEV